MNIRHYYCDVCGRELPRGTWNLVDLRILVVRDVQYASRIGASPAEYYDDFCKDRAETLYNVIETTMKGLIEQRKAQLDGKEQ